MSSARTWDGGHGYVDVLYYPFARLGRKSLSCRWGDINPKSIEKIEDFINNQLLSGNYPDIEINLTSLNVDSFSL